MDKATLEKEARAVFDDYLEAFQTGTRDDMDTFMHFPVAYIGEDSILVKERYPFDPEKLRTTTDFVRADFKYEVVHIDGTKAHMEAIEQYGPCPAHRKTFAPISQRAIR